MSDLPSPGSQAERLIELGLPTLAGVDAASVRDAAARAPDGLLAVHHDLLPPSVLVGLVPRGFVVTDMTDVDEFVPGKELEVPDGPLYVVADPGRGDDMANWSPNEALPALAAAGRSPMTLTEGLHWLLQRPEILARNHCFMTIGSRLTRPDGRLDARTPALWISNGTGRDGPARRDAPKLGWCWAGNRHTWLGMASAADRTGLTSA